MLLRLAGDGGGPEAFVRRRVALDELEVEHDEDAAGALDVLTESRLLTVEEDAVEVAHEALLREWPRLRSWLAEDAEGRRLHHHVIGASREWRDSERDPAELYRGARLASALDWAAEHDPELNELEREFLDESRGASEREAERQRRANRRLRTLLAGVGILLAAAAVAGAIAISEGQDAREAATIADAQRLEAEAVAEERLDQALVLATAGVALDDSVATRSVLLSTLLRSPAALGVLDTERDQPTSFALSPDGGTLAIGSRHGIVSLFDTETRELIGTHQAPGPVWTLEFDRLGESLAVTGNGMLGAGSLEIVDLDTLRVRNDIPLGDHPAAPEYYATAAYSSDGRNLLVSYSTGDLPDSAPVFVRGFDASSGSPLGPAVRVGPKPISTVLLSAPAGPAIQLTGDAIFAIDANTLRVRRYPVRAVDAAISSDGRGLAFQSADGGLGLLDLASGRVRTLPRSQDLTVGAFSPEGRTLSTSSGNDVVLWDVEEGVAIGTLEGTSAPLGDHAFSPDGRTLYAVAGDGSAIIWDVAGNRGLGKPFPTNTQNHTPEPSPPTFALSPDGQTLAVARFDGRVDLIDAETLRRTGGFEAFAGGSVLAVEYAPEGRRLAVAGQNGAVGVWDPASGRRLGPLLLSPRGPEVANRYSVQALAFGTGGLLAAAGVGGDVRIWALDGRQPIDPPGDLPPFVMGLAFSPDGSQLAIPFGARGGATPDGVEIWDVNTGERLVRLTSDGEVRSVAFSTDGGLLAGGQLDGNAYLWDTESWDRVGALLTSREGEALSVAFSPDNRVLATSYNDGTVVLWDVASQQPIGAPLPGLTNWTTARFAPDGDRLFAVSVVGRAIRWDVDPDVWLQHACAVTGGISPERWQELVPNQDYLEICPALEES